MTREEAISILRNTAWLGSYEMTGKVEEAINIVAEAIPNDELISRQAAIDAVDKLSDEPIGYLEAAIDALVDLPSAQPENIIQQFRDYQVEWLTSHCDLELEPTLEEWIVRFLNDTAECFELEGRING